MISVTTDEVPNKEIVKVLGMVSGEQVTGVSFVKDWFAGFTNLLGGKSTSYTNEVTRCKGVAVEAMLNSASSHGANAVIGVQHEFTVLQMGKGSLFIASFVGTAVVVE